MRRPGVGPDPVPLILSHGWPWTFWHWSKVVDPLADPAAFGADPADAFDVIVPSLPGFGFSTPLAGRPDMNFWKIADVWHELMTGVLGHERYAAGGCDVGALVTGQLGHKYADELYAIHIGSGQKLTLFNGDRAWDLSGGRAHPLGPARRRPRPDRRAGEAVRRPPGRARPRPEHPRLRAGRLPGRHAGLDAGTLDELVRQPRGRRDRVQQGRSPHPRHDLLGGRRHRDLDPHLRQQQPLPVDAVA